MTEANTEQGKDGHLEPRVLSLMPTTHTLPCTPLTLPKHALLGLEALEKGEEHPKSCRLSTTKTWKQTACLVQAGTWLLSDPKGLILSTSQNHLLHFHKGMLALQTEKDILMSASPLLLGLSKSNGSALSGRCLWLMNRPQVLPQLQAFQ